MIIYPDGDVTLHKRFREDLLFQISSIKSISLNFYAFHFLIRWKTAIISFNELVTHASHIHPSVKIRAYRAGRLPGQQSQLLRAKYFDKLRL